MGISRMSSMNVTKLRLGSMSLPKWLSGALLAAVLSVGPIAVSAHDPTQHQLDNWYASVMQPDTFGRGIGGPMSCCGTADAYWADETHVVRGEDGAAHIIAVVTDDRDDVEMHRYHVAIGTQYEVPEAKVVGKIQKTGNPTGHAILWLESTMVDGHPQEKRKVLCYLPNNGF